VIAGSTVLSDKDKFEALGLGRRMQNGDRDVFDAFFENKDLDPVTGGLLGRYIARARQRPQARGVLRRSLCRRGPDRTS
jgi:hypothetical protein